MASFQAELEVGGRTYPVRSCSFEFTQATNERGRVAAKVRHGLVHVALDVPHDDLLLDWAATAHKPLNGRVIFRNAQGGAALETLSWEGGQCVGYQEAFLSGSVNEGAYVCHLTIAAPKLTMAPGGPASYVGPAAGEHGRPQQAFVDPFVVPLLTPAPVAVPVIEAVAEAAALTALAPVAMVLALILGTATPAGGPGILQPHFPPVNRDELRLRELVAKHATGTLAPDEEAELIALLGKVRGIYVTRLAELPTLPSGFADANTQPGGFATRINSLDEPENKLALLRENESAAILARAGYKVEQNPTIRGTTRNPDYLIEDKVFDCYSPTNSKPRSIATTLEGKIKKGQAERFVLNLEDSKVDMAALRQQLTQYPVAGLQEIIIVKQNKVVPFFP